VLNGLAELAHGDPRVPADLTELVDLVQRSNRDMQAVVRGFLDSSLGSMNMSDAMFPGFALDQLVSTVVQSNRDYAARKKIDLRVAVPAELPQLRGDAFRIRQVLENLVGNAIKFSPPDSLTEVRATADDHRLTIEVIDSGPGLTDEDQRRLFIKGARLSNKPTGGEDSTGVGLALCKEIMQQVGGEIGARNNPGAGATFWIRLPLR
jgi:signal transduction histidine kinase